MFGQSQQPQATVNSNAYGNNPLFASVGTPNGNQASPGPIATPLVSNSVKKKPATLPQFKLAPRSPVPGARPPVSKGLFGISPASTARKSGFPIFDEDLLINPDAFTPRSNLKKLVIERTASTTPDLLAGGVDLRGVQNGPPRSKVENIVPQLKVVKEVETVPEPEQKKTEYSSPAQLNGTQSDHGKYWTSPPLSKLFDYSKAELSKLQGLQVGRRGYGQVTFSKVDLSALDQFEDIAGKIVVFEDKMCLVYPEEDAKPAAGKELNVPATITLEGCFPLSKDRREPIRDPAHPRFIQHVDRLRRMAHTEFVDYVADSGTWVFKVQHF